METKNKDLVLAIYVTHGSSLVIKGWSNNFDCMDKKNPQINIQVAFNQEAGHGLYQIINDQSLISKQISLPSSAGSKGLDLEAFQALIHTIQSRWFESKRPIVLCVDGNLGFPGQGSVSHFFHELVLAVNPTYLLPFSATEECLADARHYLRGSQTVLGYKLRKPQWGSVGSQADVRAIIHELLSNDILFNELLALEPLTTQYVNKKTCFSFFRSLLRMSQDAKVGVELIDVASKNFSLLSSHTINTNVIEIASTQSKNKF